MQKIPEYFLSNPNINIIKLQDECLVVNKTIETSKIKQEYYISNDMIGFVTKGSKKIYNNSHNIQVNEGQFFFIPKGIYYLIDIDNEQKNFSGVLLFLTPLFLRKQLQHLKSKTKNQKSQPIKLKTSPLLTNFFEALNLNLNSNNTSTKVLELKLKELVHIIENDSENSVILNTINLTLNNNQHILNVMEEHFTKQLSINDFANLCNRSLSAFKRDFKEAYNDTPGNWLRNKRLEKASYLLKTKDISVTECAIKVGYENCSYFIKIFKNQYGVSPKQFKLQNN